MTRFLASVTGPEEAAVALAGGADIIDLKDPEVGALGALAPALVRRAVDLVAGRRPVSAVAGNPSLAPRDLVSAVSEMAATGVDYVKVGLYAGPGPEEAIRALAERSQDARLVGVLFAEDGAGSELLGLLGKAGFAGVMFDTRIKDGRRLLDHLEPALLRSFVERAREAGLLAGLAGSLEAPDVARLLPLGPDILGFRGALCGAGDRRFALDADRVAAIRALIPEQHELSSQPADYRLLADRHYTRDEERTDASSRDRIYVRDFVIPMSIGAYAHERGRQQRVRFNVMAEVRRRSRAADDMEGVFSYDVITDAIRAIAGSEHIAVVETLAERIAAAVLEHESVRGVVVRVEKLDVGPGSVGIEIERRKSADTASILELFPTSIGKGPKAAS
ncbi:MAG: (5-formylfuran-3-yl)methyl phosphate synthase [Parvibaculaceae bacterium]